MKKRLFAAIICMILVFSMMPVGVFAEGSGSMEPGLYWRKTRLSQDDEGHVIFLPTDDDYSKDLIEGSTGGSSNVLEFFYVDDSGEKHHLKCSDLDFTVVVSESANSSNGKFSLSGDSTSVQLLGSKLNLQNYFVNITIFDDNGRIVETFNHTRSGSGGCSDSFTASNLVAGTRYTAQMTYANGSDTSAVGYIEYQSSTFSFTYQNATRYTFTYSCREVA